MASKKETAVRDLIELCAIAKKCHLDSIILSREEIAAYVSLIQFSEKILEDARHGVKLNAYQRKSLQTELLKYWNNHLNVEVEGFWKQVEEKGLPYRQNDTFKKIIDKNRFKNVEQAIDVYNDIFSRPFDSIDSVTLEQKLEQLYEVVKTDRDRRLKQMRKWIKNQRVSFSESGKFCENYAYFKRTGLYDEIFGDKERRVIGEIVETIVKSAEEYIKK